MLRLIKKRDLSQLLLEIVGIAFAVFLGMWVNEWNESRKKEDQVELIYAAIVKEIENNQKELERVTKLGQKQVERLESYLQSMAAAKRDGKPFAHDFDKLDWQHNSAILKSVAWDAANTSNLTIEFEYAILTELSGIYNDQQLYNEYAIGLFQDFSELSTDLALSSDKTRAIVIHTRDTQFGLALLSELNKSYLEFLADKKRP